MADSIDGNKIAKLRTEQQLGLRQLAEKAEVDHSVVSRLERNLQGDCMLSVAVAISSALGVTVDYLLQESPQDVNQALIPELQATINTLAQYSSRIQRQAAGILRGYLSTLDQVDNGKSQTL